MLAGASIAIIPILVVYLFANKQFIAGLTSGAVKLIMLMLVLDNI